MANPFYISYVFGDTLTVGRLLGGGDRVRLTLQLEVNEDGTDVSYLAETRDLKVRIFGNVSLEYDFDDFLLVPAEYQFEIYDPEGELTDLLFDGSSAEAVNKGFFVKLEILYKNAASYEVEFSGYIIPEVIEFDKVSRVFTFTAAPRTNKINQAFLYPRTFDATLNDPSNPLSLTYQTVGAARKWDWIYLSDLIEKIFQLVNPSINISFYHDWKFFGSTNPDFSSPIFTKDDLTFNDLILDHNYIGAVFGSSLLAPSIENCGDLLKELAFCFGSLAGVKNQDVAFFRQVYYWDPANVQTIQSIIADGFRRKYKFSSVDFVDINSQFFQQDPNQKNRFVLQNFKPNGFAPTFNPRVYGTNGLEKQIALVADFINWTTGGNLATYIKSPMAPPYGHYYNIYGVNSPQTINFTSLYSGIYGAPQDSEGNYFLSLSNFLANYHYILKGALYRSQVYEFPLDGRNYDFVKGFQYDGGNFSIISMNKNIDEGTTTVEAIKVGSYDTGAEDGDNGGEIITDPISFNVVESVAGEAGFSVADINAGSKTIASLAATETLEEIVVVISTALNGTITKFQISDGTEVLFDMDLDIIGGLSEVGKFLKTIYKKYSTLTSLTLTIEGSGTTTGAGTIFIKKLKAV